MYELTFTLFTFPSLCSLSIVANSSYRLLFAVVLQTPPILSRSLLTQSPSCIFGLPRLLFPSISPILVYPKCFSVRLWLAHNENKLDKPIGRGVAVLRLSVIRDDKSSRDSVRDLTTRPSHLRHQVLHDPCRRSLVLLRRAVVS